MVETPLDPRCPMMATATSGNPKKVWCLGTSLTEGTDFGGLETGGWRWPLKAIAAVYGVHFDYVGTQVSQDGVIMVSSGSPVAGTELNLYAIDREHDGYGGYTLRQITAKMEAQYLAVKAQVGDTPIGQIIIEFGANDSILDGSGNAVGLANFQDCFRRISDVAKALGNPNILFVGRLPRHDDPNAWLSCPIETQAQSQYSKDLVRQYCAKGFNWQLMSPYDSTLADHWNVNWHVSSSDVHFNLVGYARVATEIWKALNCGFDPPKHMNPFVRSRKITSAANTYFPWGALVTPCDVADVIVGITWGGDSVTIGTDWTRGVTYPVPLCVILSSGSTMTKVYTAEYAPGMLL